VTPASLVGESGARRVSPFLFLLVILSFFLAFAGVSCNATATKSALASIAGSQGLTTSQTTALNTCLDSLNGLNILSYSGWQLVFGRNPSVASLPEQCDQSGAGNAVGSANTSQANIGPQLLSILALASVGLALLFALAGVAGLLKGRNRAFVAIIFGAGAAVLLLLDHLHVDDILMSKIAASEGSSIPGFNAAMLFNVNPGLGLIIALAILAAAVVYNLAALVVGASPVTAALPEPIPPQPPPVL
jgi:hypothetical protein